MKTTELKIGDIVGYKDANIPVTVQAVLKYQIALINEESAVFTEDLIPIPLTDEILEKNEWRKQCTNNEMAGWSNNKVKLYPQAKEYGGGYAFYYSCNSVQYVHYVHELQHILWALGMDDNLKI